jgi:transcriptional regulator with XRE-family HTH domain
MNRVKYALLPRLTKILEKLGEDIKLARLRRKLSAEQVAERAGISRSTLWQIEKGQPNVSMGYYAQVLFVLGLEKNLSAVAADDELGRKLQDAEILVKKRAPKKKTVKTVKDEQ